MPHPPKTLTIDGETRTLADWCRARGLHPSTVKSRLAAGLPPAEALARPAEAKFARRGPRAAPEAPEAPPLKWRADGRGYVQWRDAGEKRQKSFGRGAAARAAHRRWKAEWEARAASGAPAPLRPGQVLTCAMLADRFMAHAEARYSRSEAGCYRLALTPLLGLYAGLAAAELDGPRLKAAQAAMAARVKRDGSTWCRQSVNRHVWRITNVWGWGVSEGDVPAAVHQALLTVPPLRRGHRLADGARVAEGRRVRPVDDAAVEATLAHLEEPAATMVRLQRRLGCRPQEVCALRVEDLDRSGGVWLYRVSDDWNKLLGHDRDQEYWVGPRGQAELLPLIGGRTEGYLFAAPRRRTRAHYSVGQYRRAIGRAAERAGLAPWGPHRLRHTRSTEVRHEHGLDAQKAAIGTRTERIADVYAEKNAELARKIALSEG
jgi:integrase